MSVNVVKYYIGDEVMAVHSTSWIDQNSGHLQNNKECWPLGHHYRRPDNYSSANWPLLHMEDQFANWPMRSGTHFPPIVFISSTFRSTDSIPASIICAGAWHFTTAVCRPASFHLSLSPSLPPCLPPPFLFTPHNFMLALPLPLLNFSTHSQISLRRPSFRSPS